MILIKNKRFLNIIFRFLIVLAYRKKRYIEKKIDKVFVKRLNLADFKNYRLALHWTQIDSKLFEQKLS